MFLKKTEKVLSNCIFNQLYSLSTNNIKLRRVKNLFHPSAKHDLFSVIL